MSVAQENGDRSIAVRDCQVWDAVAVEVSTRNAAWTRAHPVSTHKERAIAAAKQDRDRAVRGVGRNQINLAITVQIARCQSEWIVSCGGRTSQRERPIALAQPDRETIRIGFSDIELAIFIKIRHDYG